MNICQLIHPYKYIKSLCDNDINNQQNKPEKNIWLLLHIYGARTILLLFKDDLMITETRILSNWK